MARLSIAISFILVAFVLLSCATAIESAAMVSAINAKINNMKWDDRGFVHVGDDGVARSYSMNGSVLDYFPLSNAEVMAFGEAMIKNANLPESQEYREHLATVYEGVTGHDVSEEEMRHPHEAVLPYQLRGGRTLETASDVNLESANTREPGKIFERQLGFCNSQWCINSVGCLILNCGPCRGVDEMTNLSVCQLP